MSGTADWSDSITIMQARGGKRMAKTLLRNGTFLNYDDAYTYNARTIQLTGLDDLWPVLHDLLHRHDMCVVRGSLAQGDSAHRIRRLIYPDKDTGDAPTLKVVPRRWLAIDADGIERPEHVPAADLLACADAAIEKLPRPFWQAECIVQASAGHGIKPGCRLRLWFWCDRPMTGGELKRWLKPYPVDPSVFGSAQPIYTAAPIFAPGVSEHLPQRIALYPGEQRLQCPSAEELAPPPPKPQPPPEAIATPVGAEPYVRKALERAADAILSAGEGKRHPTLAAEARSLARLVKEGLLREADLRSVLTCAAEHAGKTNANEIASCIDWGMNNPSNGALPETRNAA
jgi:hypothetical protein